MKIRLAKKIMKVTEKPPKDLKSSLKNGYWFKRWDEALNQYGCVYFCDDWVNCNFHNKFDRRLNKAKCLTSKKK